jgi:hypothetical protein
MGSFFTNVQLRAKGDPDQVRTRLMQALQAHLAREGYAELVSEEAAGAGDEDADRSILLGPAGRWIAVYDEESESQDERPLHALAAVLSAALETVALTILVHDSDVLRLGLFEGGRQLGHYDSNPSFSAGEPGEPRKLGKRQGAKARTKETDLDVWRALLDEGADSAALIAALKDHDQQTEAQLDSIANVIGLDGAQATLGYRYAREQRIEQGQNLGLACLRFRRTVRPAWEKASEGPPRFVRASSSVRIERAVGEEAGASVAVRNVGGPSQGLDVVVWGEALDKEIFSLRRARLLPPDKPHGNSANWLDVDFVPRKDAAGHALFVASFPDVDLPSGAGPTFDDLLAGRATPREMSAADARGRVYVNISGDLRTAGASTIFFGFFPDAARESGSHVFSFRVVAFPPSRRPLNVEPRADGRVLRQIEGGSTATTLFCLATCGVSQARAAPVVASLIERWGASWPEGGTCSTAIFHAERDTKVKTGRVKAARFFRGARWKKLREALADEARVSIERKDDESREDADGFPVTQTDGAVFGGSIRRTASADPSDVELPTVALWMNIEGKSEETISGARDLLRQLCDELVRETEGVQAIMGRWDWRPSTLDWNPYEVACGLQGPFILQRSWLTRFLRAVTDDWIWLGPELLTHVDREKLAQAAEMETLPRGVRVRLRPESSLDALEAALAPILPVATDGHAATQRFYGRGST